MSIVVGYTTGVYDMFHVGHLNLLRRARATCDHLIVGVTTDQLAEAKKTKRPIVPLEERMEIVRAVRYVDEVVPQETYDKFDAWQRLSFDVMYVGDDWRGTPAWRKHEEDFSAVGVRIHYLPYTVQTSSTILRAKLLA